MLQIADVQFELLAIRPGEFLMGSQHGLPLELPAHRVTIGYSFSIGRTLVTQEQWQAVMGANPSCFTGEANLPVDSLSWDDCQEFCRRASERSGRRVRLPSEAEWEYCCRAGTTSEFFFGDDDRQAGEYAWFDRNSRDRTRPVASGLPNAWGLYDMVGNLWQWAEDVWFDDYQHAPQDGGARPDDGSHRPRRVLRGGAWDMDAFRLRSAYRSCDWRNLATNRFGLRIVVE